MAPRPANHTARDRQRLPGGTLRGGRHCRQRLRTARAPAHPQCGYLFTSLTTGAGPGSVEAPGGTLSLSAARRKIGVAHTWRACSPGAVAGVAQEGFAPLEVALPSSSISTWVTAKEAADHGPCGDRDGPA